MKITLAAIAPRRTRSKSEASDRLIADFKERAVRYVPIDSEVTVHFLGLRKIADELIYGTPATSTDNRA
jgi:hypothetical protein